LGQAITQLDQTTQQNAALVEEMSAAAEKLKQQAAELVSAMAMFKVARSA
jgi:methyl-accepting chemotaxis protein